VFGTPPPQLAVGDAGPRFELGDQQGQLHRLSDHRGRWVVLYFYPKDETSGCTIEACRFRDDLPALQALGVQLFGVSLDSGASHAAFAGKLGLSFPLLADERGEVTKSYGALRWLGPFTRAWRHTFIVDPDGKIARIYRDVDPESHSRQVMEDVQALQAQRR